MPRRPAFDDAKIHLEVLGRDRELSFQVRVGPAPVMALLPTARAISTQISAISVEHAAAQGKTPSCRAGCAACCRQLVPIAPMEAQALASAVATMPSKRRAEVRRRFAEAVARMEAAGLLDARAPKGRSALVSAAEPGKAAWDDVSARYFAARIDCPFLEDESCSVYAERPITCREYIVTTPAAWCDELSTQVEAVERPARLSEALTDAEAKINGAAPQAIPLALALEWAEAHGARMRNVHDGEEMFWALLENIETDGSKGP